MVDKPAGLLVHPYGAKGSLKGEGESLTDWLTLKYPEARTVGDAPDTRPGIVHRLDRDTSGVMIIVKTQRAFDHFKSLFQAHQIQKIYLAIARGVFKNKKGTISAPIGIRQGSVKRSTRSPKMAKEAVTEYEVIREGGSEDAQFSVLRVYPKTGRTHQIRVHLASVGHPIFGDRLYGGKRKNDSAERLMLHALSIEFTDISGNRIKVEAEPPPELSTPEKLTGSKV